ncbi:MAG: GNAT family N-acetyltransferase [Mangrovicoccus sp.]|nr:GNAT family N-acetyltransferase [Mangrovicoccus sp.]
MDAVLQGKDGRDYRIRPIAPGDVDSLIRGYDSLSDQAKWFRMLHAQPHLSREMAERFCKVDHDDEFCLVIEGQGALEGDLLGGARIGGIGPGKAGEFSVSLRPEARGLGLARQALIGVINVAKDQGCSLIWGSVARRNDGMRALAERLGFTLRIDPDDRTLLLAELPLT